MIPIRSSLFPKAQTKTRMTLRSHGKNTARPSKLSLEYSPDKALMMLENLKTSFLYNRGSQESRIYTYKAVKFLQEYETANVNEQLNSTMFICSNLFASINRSPSIEKSVSSEEYRSLQEYINDVQDRVCQERSKGHEYLRLIQGKDHLNTRQLSHFYRKVRSPSMIQLVLMQLNEAELDSFKQSLSEATSTNVAVIELKEAVRQIEINKSSLELTLALRNQNAKKVKDILEHEEVNFSFIDQFGKTPIQYALNVSCKDTANALISSKQLSIETLSKTNSKGSSPLTEIASKGSNCIVMALLNCSKLSEELLRLKDSRGFPIISTLAERRSLEIFNALFKLDAVTPQLLELQDPSGNTAIANMVRYPIPPYVYPGVVNLILNSEKVSLLSLTAPNSLEFSALHRMVDVGCVVSNLAILNSSKITVDALCHENFYGDTALGRMALKGCGTTHDAMLNCEKVPVEKLLQDNSKSVSPLLIMIESKRASSHQAIVRSEKITRDVLNTIDNSEGSYLQSLVFFSHPKIHRMLLESPKVMREDLIQSKNSSTSPLALMVQNGSFESNVSLLTSDKVTTEDLLAITKDGSSILSLMAANGCIYTHSAMLNTEKVTKEALVAKDASGQFPLQIMASKKNVELAAEILESDSVDAKSLLVKNSEGSFPLIELASILSGTIHEAILLSDKVSLHSLTLQNARLDTPLHYLTSNGVTGTLLSLLASEKVDQDALLIQNQQKVFPLLHIARSTSYEVHAALIESEKVQAKSLILESQDKWTPLKKMMVFGSYQTAKLLLASDKVSLELLCEGGTSNSSAFSILIEVNCSKTKLAILDSEKITKELLCQRGPKGDTPLLRMSCSNDNEVVLAILSSNKVDRFSLTTKNDSDISPIWAMVTYGSDEICSAILQSGKVHLDDINDLYGKTPLSLGYRIASKASRETLELLKERYPQALAVALSSSKKAEDLSTCLKIEYVQEPSSLETLKGSLRYLADSNGEDLFRVIVSFSKRARLIAAIEHEKALCARLSFYPLIKLSSGTYNTLPTPSSADTININDLEKIGLELFSRSSSSSINLNAIHDMIARTQNRVPYIGLPNHEETPDQFKRAYANIEKALKVITVIAHELNTKHQQASDDRLKIDYRERLSSFYSRLSGIARRCGTRYTQDLPIFYQELSLEGDLECIKSWQSQDIALPAISDPSQAIREHLTPLLSALKMKALNQVYTKKSPSSDSHSISSFWKAIADEFHLDEDIDPTTEPLQISVERVKGSFLDTLHQMNVIASIKPSISPSGDNNPYTSLIAGFAHQCGYDRVETQMKAFNMDEKTYEYKEMTDGFVALCLLESGLARLY